MTRPRWPAIGPEFLEPRDRDRIEIIGDLDLGKASLVHGVASKSEGRTLTFDLSRVTFIDSSGIAVLIKIKRANPLTNIVGATPQVISLFRMLGVATLLLGAVEPSHDRELSPPP